METVGVRQLKQNLSRYLKKVKQGNGIIVTDRHREVAVILPLSADTIQADVLNAVKNGIATWSGGKPSARTDRIVLHGETVSSAILEDRR